MSNIQAQTPNGEIYDVLGFIYHGEPVAIISKDGLYMRYCPILKLKYVKKRGFWDFLRRKGGKS